MSSEVERAVRAENARRAQEEAEMEAIYEELQGHYRMLECIGLAVVRARETGEDQQVPGILIHGVPLHVKAAEVAEAHPPDDGPAPKKPDDPKIILPR